MTLDNGKIQLTWALALWILAQPLRPTSRKLLVSMLHQQELRAGGFRGDGRPTRCWAPLGALRARVGPKGANDARAIRQLREELLALGIVIWCAVERHGRGWILRWEFHPEIVAEMSTRSCSDYVLLDLAELGRLRSHAEIEFYVHLRRVWGMKAPSIELPLSPEHGRAAQRRQDRALSRLADMLGARFHVALVHCGDAPVPERLSIKVEHAGTRWFPGALEKAPPGARRWTVGPAPGTRPE